MSASHQPGAPRSGGSDDNQIVVGWHRYDMFPVRKKMLHRRGGDLCGGQQQCTST